MAVALDATSTKTLTTGSSTWTHTPSGTPKGVLVVIVTNEIIASGSMTYGGVNMTHVSESPARSVGSEDGSVHIFFLGSNVPTGAQTVSFTAPGATWFGAAFTVT